MAVQHPFEKRYSWRGPNRKPSRFDYFMITSDIEAFETEFIEKVKGDIKTLTEEYESDPSIDIATEDKQFDINYQLLWDIIKMKFRESAISFSSFQKKEQNDKEKELLYKISLLNIENS
ncbi:Hypothetical predicted protein [Mytilus galloprovincialis]|uniref:Uncharacterized protein n=1 Tax=Mytilus galloprovincialis TaxID=29158 RepID=A0A8B6E3R4_MYTGA|nr:Hypothetical predicted protein [Mytilus galloprovincialis]